MSHYYYLGATLPSLQFGAAAPYTRKSFLDLCVCCLDAETLAFLDGILLLSAPSSPPSIAGSGLLARYYAWERGVRTELARLRARKLGLQEGRVGHEGGLEDSATARAAQAAFQAPSPLEGELVLERERWNFLDSLSPFQSFDLDSLVAYFLKLLILERLEALSVEKGEAGYRRVYADIMETWRASKAPGAPASEASADAFLR